MSTLYSYSNDDDADVKRHLSICQTANELYVAVRRLSRWDIFSQTASLLISNDDNDDDAKRR
jgi:hypothetical protein